MNSRTRLLLAAILVAWSASTAGASEIRRITFPDGRTFVGEVVATGATSLTLRIPSGDMDIPYSANPEISPAGAAEVTSQAALSIVVLETKSPADLAWRADEINDFLVTRLAAIPHTRVTGAESLPPDTRASIADCGQSIGCMLRALRGTGVVHGVVSFVEHHEDGEQLRLISLGVPEQVERSRAEIVLLGDVDAFANRVLVLGYRILGLIPLAPIPADAPVVLATAGGERVESDRGGEADGTGDGESGGTTPDGAELMGGETETNPDEADTSGHAGRFTGGDTGGQATVTATELQRRRRASIALGFVPFPGLGSAHLGDPSGFVLSLVFDVGAGAGLVYLFGATSPTPLGFYLPAILSTYGVGVLINQIAAAVSYRRYRSGAGVTARVDGHRERTLSLVPLVSASPGTTDLGPSLHLGFALTGW